MTTRLKFVMDTVLSYGPQKVFAGQVLDVENDAEANALIAQGVAVLDAPDPVSAEPLIDGGLPVPGDPGGEVETEDQTG